LGFLGLIEEKPHTGPRSLILSFLGLIEEKPHTGPRMYVVNGFDLTKKGMRLWVTSQKFPDRTEIPHLGHYFAHLGYFFDLASSFTFPQEY
jgi:hypothetical protein